MECQLVAIRELKRLLSKRFPFSANALAFVSKRWLKKPMPVQELIRKLGYRLVEAIDEHNYILTKGGRFYIFHISWGSPEAVQKYKLFRYECEVK